jgi:hypothetical protein
MYVPNKNTFQRAMYFVCFMSDFNKLRYIQDLFADTLAADERQGDGKILPTSVVFCTRDHLWKDGKQKNSSSIPITGSIRRYRKENSGPQRFFLESHTVSNHPES